MALPDQQPSQKPNFLRYEPTMWRPAREAGVSEEEIAERKKEWEVWGGITLHSNNLLELEDEKIHLGTDGKIVRADIERAVQLAKKIFG